jgi:hypothetical protein
LSTNTAWERFLAGSPLHRGITMCSVSKRIEVVGLTDYTNSNLLFFPTRTPTSNKVKWLGLWSNKNLDFFTLPLGRKREAYLKMWKLCVEFRHEN